MNATTAIASERFSSRNNQKKHSFVRWTIHEKAFPWRIAKWTRTFETPAEFSTRRNFFEENKFPDQKFTHFSQDDAFLIKF